MDFLHLLESDCGWRLKKNGDFDIYSYYNALRGVFFFHFPLEGIWGVKAFRRVSFFVWMAAWGKILTGENLRRKGFTIVDWCCMCHSSGEIVDHLLIHCVWGGRGHKLWSFVFRLFGVSLGSDHVLDHLFGWRYWLGKHSLDIWNLALLCLM